MFFYLFSNWVLFSNSSISIWFLFIVMSNLIFILFISICFVLDLFLLHYFLRFVFIGLILGSWPSSWVSKINTSRLWSSYVILYKKILILSFNIWFIRNWSWYFFFTFLYVGLFQSYDYGRKVSGLTQDDLNYYFFAFF
jgi:hypothetical protein